MQKSYFSLAAKKSNDYKYVVIFQAIVLILGLTLSDFLNFIQPGKFRSFIYALFLVFGVIYMFSLWNLLKDFTSNTWFLKIVFWLLVCAYIIALMVENPFIKIISQESRPPFLFFIHLILFSIEIVVIFLAIRDIFSGDHASQSKLWGSACIYLLIIFTFSSLYDLIVISNPDAFGKFLRAGFSSYSECVYYSLKSLLKMESIYSDTNRIVHNISVIQSLTGELFLALLVGNLLSKQEKLKLPSENKI